MPQLANPNYTKLLRQPTGYSSFAEFYPFYLGEHSTKACRRLHVVGTSAVVGLSALAAAVQDPRFLLVLPIAGYGMAWVGHLMFERNRPATFLHPWYSLMGDFKMWWEVVTRQRAF